MTTPTTGTLNITLSQASKELENAAFADGFLDSMELHRLSAETTAALAPLIFKVLEMKNPSVARPVLKRLVVDRPEWVNHRNSEGRTPLMLAASNNDLDAIDTLLAAGAQAQIMSLNDTSALDFAAQLEANHRHQRVLGDVLLESGQFTQVQKDSALYYAASRNNLGMTQSLIAHGARFGQLPQERLIAHGAGFDQLSQERTVLANACRDPMLDSPTRQVVQALLDMPDIDQIIDTGWNEPHHGEGAAIHCAALTGKTDVVALLIKAGAAVNPPANLKDVHCLTPLMIAANALHPQVVKILINAGANPCLTDAVGNTVLHYLVRAQRKFHQRIEAPMMIECVNLLIAAGADPAALNQSGNTPGDLARIAGRDAVADELDAIVSSNAMTLSTHKPATADPARVPRL